MLPNILLKVRAHLTEKAILSESKLELFLRLLGMFKCNQLLYPGVLIRKLNITMKEAYKLLEAVRELGILELNYEVYCYSCQQFTGQLYRKFSEIPDDLICENCDIPLHPLENTIVVYRVLKDDE